MQNKNEFGYERDRFPTLKTDQFDCLICQNIVKDPRECSACGNLFCQGCIDSWLQKKKECPHRCDLTTNKIQKVMSKALVRIYNDLDIKCQYQKCGKTVKLSNLVEHEKTCQTPKCVNYEICEKYINPQYSQKQVCDLPCILLSAAIQNKNNDKQLYSDIKDFFKQYYNASPSIGSNQLIKKSISSFKWDIQRVGTGIEVLNNGTQLWLKESSYMFRTALGDTPFMEGIHYWEIIADERTENELKIGVSNKRDMNHNSAFCDFEYGFAYYGLGQLRHNSNASGPQYGKRFKKSGVLGVCLNMNKGQLSFSLNGEFLGIAYNNEALKKGPIIPAVALLHCAGCKMDSNKALPSIFPV